MHSNSREAALVTMNLAPQEARFSLRLSSELATGWLDLPINNCSRLDNRVVARLGPDEWLLIAPETEGEAVEREVHTLAAQNPFSLVDISHRNIGIDIAGSHVRDILNGGCALDLSNDAFPAGTATRTLFGKAEILLLRSEPADVYRIEVWRSFAPYVEALLIELAREFLPSPRTT